MTEVDHVGLIGGMGTLAVASVASVVLTSSTVGGSGARFPILERTRAMDYPQMLGAFSVVVVVSLVPDLVLGGLQLLLA